MPGRFELKPTLAKIWHAPDNFRIMDPLPSMHRRGIIIAAIVLVVGFLLPSGDTNDAPPVTRNAQLDLQSPSQPPTEAQLQAQLVAPQNDPGQVAPVAPEPIAPAPVEMPKASSAVGRASGLKKVRRGKITDLQMLIDFFFPADGNPDPEALAYLQGRVDKATRAKITLPGVTVMEDFE